MPTIHVENDTLDLFRRAVLERHGKLYGKVREEAEVALRYHAEKLLAEEDAGPVPLASRPGNQNKRGYPQISL